MSISSSTTPRSSAMSSGAKRECINISARMDNAGLQALVQHLHIIAGALLVGESVGLSAQRIDRDCDVLRGALFRAFEDHVLDKVRNAAERRRLIPAAVADPDADRCGAHIVPASPQSGARRWGEHVFHTYCSYCCQPLFRMGKGGMEPIPPQSSVLFASYLIIDPGAAVVQIIPVAVRIVIIAGFRIVPAAFLGKRSGIIRAAGGRAGIVRSHRGRWAVRRNRRRQSGSFASAGCVVVDELLPSDVSEAVSPGKTSS